MLRSMRALMITVLALGLLAPVAGAADGSPAHSDGIPLCFGRVPTIIGTEGDDVLIGTDETDVIVGLGGKDLIMGEGRRDFICAGNGKDIVYAGWGHDKVDGQGGRDIIYGNGGNDRLKGSKGDDVIIGGHKHDIINGGGHIDDCDGEIEKRCEISPDALDLEPIPDGGQFVQPLFATTREGDPRLYVVDQIGSIYSMDENGLGGIEITTVLDIQDDVHFGGERGLLGLAFHPDSPERMFIDYIEEGSGDTVVAEYDFPLEEAAVESGSDEILRVDQPDTNHNGGMLLFGPDGYLYIGLGDGGGVGDEYENGQDTGTLLGSILRIDVDAGTPYAIPADNPFVSSAGEDEILIYGARNPWRFSFDGSDLWIADVGQFEWEEIDVIDLSATVPSSFGAAPLDPINLGWPVVEGPECYQAAECDTNGFVEPVHWYGHSGGRCSITGGYVYRGEAIPDLVGMYVFADYCAGDLMGIRVKNGEVIEEVEFSAGVSLLTSFGVDADGELLVTAQDDVYRVVPAG